MLEKMKEIIADQLGVSEDEVTLEASFKEDLDADYELWCDLDNYSGKTVSLPHTRACRHRSQFPKYSFLAPDGSFPESMETIPVYSRNKGCAD